MKMEQINVLFLLCSVFSGQREGLGIRVQALIDLLLILQECLKETEVQAGTSKFLVLLREKFSCSSSYRTLFYGPEDY